MSECVMSRKEVLEGPGGQKEDATDSGRVEEDGQWVDEAILASTVELEVAIDPCVSFVSDTTPFDEIAVE